MTERVSIRGRARPIRAALGLLLLGTCAALQAATLTIGIVGRADDERLDRKRVELGYLGQPGGPVAEAVEMALQEASFELEAGKLQVKLESVEASDPASARAALAQLEKAGAAAALVDLPAAWLSPAVTGVKLPLVNVGEAADALRAVCAPNLFHTLPSERMRADALGQALVARRWSRVLVLHGPQPEDQARLAVAQAALKRYGLKVAATKPFKLSADPRERDLANPLLLTGGVDYDAVWVIDSTGEFARSLPYRTALPRPVVGDGGLVALAWGPNFERFGAPQLNRRFMRAAKRPMVAQDWAAWIGTKAIVQAALEKPAAPDAAQIAKAMARADFTLDGFKGARTSFRAWDRQLRQPLLLTDGVGIIGVAPTEGILHPRNVLDTLGVDQPGIDLQGSLLKLSHALRALRAITTREVMKFARQYGRLVSALVRPLLWLAVFAAGFRNVFGISIVPPYDTYIPYDVYIAPGLVGMVLLFNGMQSSLAMVYDREMGLMRLLLTAPLPRWWLLLCKLLATAVLSLLQALAFVLVALLLGTDLPVFTAQFPAVLLATIAAALMLGSLGLLLSVHIKQLENFAGTMNFVIFPMYFMSTALYPLWKLEESGARWVYELARFNPFTHAVEWMRFALYDKDPGIAPWVVIGTTVVCFVLASWGYDPQRGFGQLAKRGG